MSSTPIERRPELADWSRGGFNSQGMWVVVAGVVGIGLTGEAKGSITEGQVLERATRLPHQQSWEQWSAEVEKRGEVKTGEVQPPGFVKGTAVDAVAAAPNGGL